MKTLHSRAHVPTRTSQLTLSLLGSSLRTQTVHMNQCSFKAVRRMRTTLYRICYAWNEGSPARFSRITPLGTPLMECIAYLGQGGDASRFVTSHTLRSQSTRMVALPVFSSFRAVRPIVPEEHGKSHKSEYEKKRQKEPTCQVVYKGIVRDCYCSEDIGDNKNKTQEDDTAYYYRFSKRKASRAWVQFLLRVGCVILSFLLRVHKLLWHVCFLFFCTISRSLLIRNCPLRSCAFLFVVLPHTTKSLTGGVQNTWASETVASVQYVPFPLVGSSAVEVL